MSVVAIDAKDFLRKGYRRKNGKYSEFRGCLGIAAKIESEDYKSQYDTVMEKLCMKYDILRKHRILKSYTILSTLRYPKGLSFLEDFFSAITPSLREFNVYYTIIPSTKVPKIKKYGAEKTGVELVNPVDFLKELSSSYPHCCAWKYLNDHPENATTPMYLDYFEGELTDAWKDIRDLPNIKIFTAGDECNCYVSTADILTKLIDLRLFKNKKALYITDIKECFPDYPIKISFVDQLKYITPITKEKIDTSVKLAHPIVFILKEGLFPEVAGPSAKERDVIGSSPLMEKILHLAYEVDGCYKFFDLKVDQKVIRDGDYFIYLGKKGRETALYLRRLGYKIKIISSRKIMGL